MRRSLFGVAALALIVAVPATAQILGGGGLGGGATGGLRGGLGGTIGGSIDRGGRVGGDTIRRARSSRPDRGIGGRRADGRLTGNAAADIRASLGERRVMSRGSASAGADLNIDESMLRTRGAAAATRRGLRRVASTASGVQVFVPQAVVAAPAVPGIAVHSYPAYGAAYYYEPGAVFVGASYVDAYMDRQYEDLEASLRGTGATVERRGDNLVVLFPADVTFAFDRADIRSRFYGPLDAFASVLNEYPGSDVEIVGHTDAAGSDLYNVGLSERRGRSVAEFLVAQRVSPVRLVVQAMGESEPVASNATIEGRAANRRVEMIVHPRAG